MALSASDAIKTAFGSLKTDVGKKLIGIFFLIQAVNLGSTYLMSLGNTAVLAIGGLLTLLASLAYIAAIIGGLRSLRDQEVKKNFFTKNLLWPFGRTLGANLTTAAFAYIAGSIFLLPAFIAVLGGATTTSPFMTGGLSGLSLLGIGLGLIGAILGLTAFIYVTVTLVLAQPLIAIDDKRMFQALDESIRRTKGNRLAIFLTGLTTLLIYALAIALGAALGLINEQLGVVAVQLIVAPIFIPVFLSLLNYFSEELPLE